MRFQGRGREGPVLTEHRRLTGGRFFKSSGQDSSRTPARDPPISRA